MDWKIAKFQGKKKKNHRKKILIQKIPKNLGSVLVI
jgi:hypothetical protein